MNTNSKKNGTEVELYYAQRSVYGLKANTRTLIK